MRTNSLIQHLGHYILKVVLSNSLHQSPCCHGDKHRMQKFVYLLYQQSEIQSKRHKLQILQYVHFKQSNSCCNSVAIVIQYKASKYTL